ncbi:MAG: hypothetical protein ACSLFF_07235 [Solirubrobacterales bacterium]
MPGQEVNVELATPGDELLASASHLSGPDFLRAIPGLAVPEGEVPLRSPAASGVHVGP